MKGSKTITSKKKHAILSGVITLPAIRNNNKAYFQSLYLCRPKTQR